jgi:hypothetical protein
MTRATSALGICFVLGALASCVDVEPIATWTFSEEAQADVVIDRADMPTDATMDLKPSPPEEDLNPDIPTPDTDPPETPPTPSEGWQIEAIHPLDVDKVTSMAMAIDDADNRYVMYINDGWLNALSQVDGAWSNEVIGRAGGRTGKQLDLVTESKGVVHAAYWWGGYIQYVTGQIGDWQIEEVGQVAGATNPSISLALSPTGAPHVLYRFSASLWHSERIDGQWILQNRGDAGIPRDFLLSAEAADIGIAPSGTLRIALQTHNASIASEPNLPLVGQSSTRVVTGDQETWDMHTVSSTDSGAPFHSTYKQRSHVSQALDVTGGAHLAFLQHRWTEGVDPVALGELHYARPADGGWAVETVDAEGDVGLWASMALSDEQRPHVSYFAAAAGDLRYARHDGVDWQIESVDTDGETGLFGTLALDSTDDVHIAYLDRGAGTINWARKR